MPSLFPTMGPARCDSSERFANCTFAHRNTVQNKPERDRVRGKYFPPSNLCLPTLSTTQISLSSGQPSQCTPKSNARTLEGTRSSTLFHSALSGWYSQNSARSSLLLPSILRSYRPFYFALSSSLPPTLPHSLQPATRFYPVVARIHIHIHICYSTWTCIHLTTSYFLNTYRPNTYYSTYYP